MSVDLRVYQKPHKRVMNYSSILEEVQSHISARYASTLADAVTEEAARNNVQQIITKYLNDNGIGSSNGETTVQLTARLYDDMSQFGAISEAIDNPAVEEITATAYDDIEIVTAEKAAQLEQSYSSARQFQDIAKKIMSIGGITLDEAQPISDGYIRTGVRASAIIPPCVDDDVGAAVFIRRQSMADISREVYVRTDTATEDELDLIQALINYGVSVAFAGPRGSGKTTDMNYFLKRTPSEKGMFIIEDTRELDQIRRDAKGRRIGKVLHTKTRHSKNGSTDISMNDLLLVGLRSNMDYIIPSEMRAGEAMTAQEAARTGQTVVTSLHSNTARSAYRRILTMCNMSGTRITDRLLLSMIVEAFPIIVHKRRLPDNSRHIMEIFEATGLQGDEVQGQTLYRYHVADNVYRDGKIVQVVGAHEKMSPISDELAQRLLEGGAPLELVRRFSKSA